MFPWALPTEPVFDCTGAIPMGKNLGRERQTCRCRSRWVSGPFKCPREGRVHRAGEQWCWAVSPFSCSL